MIKYILFFVCLSSFSQGSIVFDTDFETLADVDNSADAWRVDVSGNNSLVTLTGGARSGSFCARMVNNGSIRNEIVKQSLFNWNTEYWVGYSVKVIEVVPGFRIITQHRPLPSGVNSFTIRTATSSSMIFYTSTDSDFVNTTPGTSAIDNTESTQFNYALGQWVDIVLHFYLDDTTAGYYEAWVDGVKVIDIQNSPTVYNRDLTGALKTEIDYAKIGLYYGDGAVGGEVHFDAYKVWQGAGGSYEDVSPLGLSIGTGGGTPPLITTTGTGPQKTQTAQLITN